MYYLRVKLTSSPERASPLFGFKPVCPARLDLDEINNQPRIVCAGKQGRLTYR
jgi:hypothetical protein